MKKVLIMIMALVLMTGFAMADRGIDPVPETQGITTATTLDLVGNFASTTDIQWRITDSFFGLDEIPPLMVGKTYYASTYSEDTYSNGIA
jgi:opacity protein-like surface antigen